MTNQIEFQPDWVSAPGDTIVDILNERGLSLTEFAERIEHTPEQVTDILQGRSTITISMARKLEHVLGASVEFWMARDFQYREDITMRDARDEEWKSELPLGDMIKFGWLKPIPLPASEVTACLNYFNVGSIQEWREKYTHVQEMVTFRTSPAFDSRPGAVAAWLRQGGIEAETIKCKPWNSEKFKKSLYDVRTLTRWKTPEIFINKLMSICSESGVAIVVVRAPTGCRASGATRFLSEKKAILQLSFRYLTDDQFWFTFFHEAGHLLLHGNNRLFLEVDDGPSTLEEEEANEFAEHILIPSEYKQELLKLTANTRKVVRYAVRLGISPGIVVGQLQHYGRIRQNQLNFLKRRFRWEN